MEQDEEWKGEGRHDLNFEDKEKLGAGAYIERRGWGGEERKGKYHNQKTICGSTF